MQRNWIGRSEGARVTFALEGDAGDADRGVHHPHRHDLTAPRSSCSARSTRWCRRLAGAVARIPAAFRKQVQAFRLQDRAARISGELEKQGFDTGCPRDQPVHAAKPVPVWVANFVLGDYGTGAIMAVPAHDQRDFEFATQVRPADSAGRRHVRTAAGDRRDAMTEAAERTARSSTPASTAGCRTEEAQQRMIAAADSSAASARARSSTA